MIFDAFGWFLNFGNRDANYGNPVAIYGNRVAKLATGLPVVATGLPRQKTTLECIKIILIIKFFVFSKIVIFLYGNRDATIWQLRASSACIL